MKLYKNNDLKKNVEDIRGSLKLLYGQESRRTA